MATLPRFGIISIQLNTVKNQTDKRNEELTQLENILSDLEQDKTELKKITSNNPSIKMKNTIQIRTSVIASTLIILFLGCNNSSNKKVEHEIITDSKTTVKTEQQWTQDQADVKALVEKLLMLVGNSDFQALDSIVSDKANLASAIIRDGISKNSVITIGDYFETQKNRERKPFYEPVNEYKILINKGQIAFVWADAILHSYGVPRTNNIDNFTLIKENGEWKFINISFTNTPLPETLKKFDLEVFAKSYAQVWSGIRPEFVAMFFEENGSLKLNENKPAVGRAQIADVAQGFMRDLPDMVISYDSLVTKATGTEFHWTLTATNSGPRGTGNKVKVSGYELWQMGENGRILKSQGHFPTEEYNSQLGIGIEN